MPESQRDHTGTINNNNNNSNNDSAAVIIQVPESMVMSRATGSSEGSISSLGNSNSRTKGPAHANPFTRAESSDSSTTNGSPPANNTSQQRQHQQHQHQQPHPLQIERTGSDEENTGGLFSAPLAWVQKSRERRRRLYLQHQAEEQLRKIAEAEGFTRNGGGEPAHHNHHHLPISANHDYQNNDHNPTGNDHHHHQHHHHADEEFKIIGTQHLSKSGEGMTAELDWDLEDDEDDLLIPKVRIHPEPLIVRNQSSEDGGAGGETSSSPSKNDFKAPAYILNPDQMHQIAIHVLPKTIAYCQWRRVYSLNRDGDSFEGFLRIIADVARTLMVVRTTRGAVFGGYADSPWRPSQMGSARFYGSALACLFSVKEPEKTYEGGVVKSPKNLLNVYRWSGKNRYIQLCDSSSKMIAFGGGGSDGAFGLCVQEDFQSGSTGPCDTFDNAPLCDQETFQIVDVEFWEFLTGVF